MAGFDDFIQELQSWDNNEADIATFLNIFEYTGFDPSIIQKKIFNLGKNDAARDVKVMCLMFLLRENNLTSLETKSSEARIKAFKAIKAKYGLTKDKISTSITLPRVAACFPWVYMQLLASLKPERPITKAELVDLDATDYPLALMAQPALSLLTHSKVNKKYALAIVCYSVRENEIFNKAAMLNNEQLRDVVYYCNIVANGRHIPDSVKKSFIEKHSTDLVNGGTGINSFTDKVIRKYPILLIFLNK